MTTKSEKLYEQLEAAKLLPLYTTTDLSYLPKLEEILLKHHLPFIEVTYRSDLATETIKRLSQSGKLIVGAGTVRTLEQAKEAVENGAQFIVSPAVIEDVVKYCVENDIPIFPGTATPRDIQLATEYGIKVVKFFPADVYGGLKAINALSGPYFDVRFVPTGGINGDNAKEFVSNEHVLAVGGSFIISEKLIAKDNGESADKALSEIIAKLG